MPATRPDAWENALSTEQQLEVFDWHVTHGGPKAMAKLKKVHGLEPATSAFYRFVHRISEQQERDRQMRAILARDNIAAMAQQVGEVSEALANGLGQAALLAISSGDPAQIELYCKQFFSAQAQLQRDRALEHEEIRIREQLKTAQEKALDALFQEIKGNAKAEALFLKFRDAVMGAAEEGAQKDAKGAKG